MALAAEGGYDVVVMRDLADQANVALGTLYNYFSSKDHLLAAAWVEWVADLERRMANRPAHGDTPAERTMALLERICGALNRQPRLVSAILTAARSPAAEVGACQAEVSGVIHRLVRQAMQLGDPVREQRVTEVLAHVLHSALLAWINGRIEMDQVVAALDNAARLLLDPHDGAAPAAST